MSGEARGVDRRTALVLGGAAVAAGLAPAAAARAPAGGVLLFDPASTRARALAGAMTGQRLVALAGDPVRLWRDSLADHAGPVSGVTRWSDFLILRGLAAEQGLRLRREEHLRADGEPMLVSWTMA